MHINLEMEKKGLVAERISYAELCATLEEIKHSSNISTKKQHFEKFLKQWKGETFVKNDDGSIEFNTENSFYSALRLFVPNLDERAFGIKELRLNALVCKELMIKPLEHASSIVSQLKSSFMSQKTNTLRAFNFQ